MNTWKKTLISTGSSIRATIQVIDRGALQVALVVDQQRRLLGLVTDGDVRRGLLRGVSLEDPVEAIMNTSPTVVDVNADIHQIRALMHKKNLRHIPVVDRDHIVIDMVFHDDVGTQAKLGNWVILMAGGEGKRLRPLTAEKPKPLLHVGSKPLLELIIESFVFQGFHKFFISVNYKAHLIEEYFGDGSKWGVTICYLREKQKMGTAGSLHLLPETPSDSFIVMNGDLLTNVNFRRLLEFHNQRGNEATVCVREHHIKLPYGVVETDGPSLVALKEKPTQQFFINAGIYVLHPSALELLDQPTYMDMTELIQQMLERHSTVGAFPLHEYWSDIGHIEDYQRAQDVVSAVFESD